MAFFSLSFSLSQTAWIKSTTNHNSSVYLLYIIVTIENNSTTLLMLMRYKLTGVCWEKRFQNGNSFEKATIITEGGEALCFVASCYLFELNICICFLLQKYLTYIVCINIILYSCSFFLGEHYAVKNAGFNTNPSCHSSANRLS